LRAVIFLAVVLAGGLYVLKQQYPPEPVYDVPEGTLEVHFLDVGQGDAALLCCGARTMLIDGGNPEDGAYVAGYLKNMGIKTLDVLVCTHPDADHCGGLAAVAEEISVGQAYCCTKESEESSFQALTAALDEKSVPFSVPVPKTVFSLGEAAVTVLWPFDTAENDNNNSLVLRVDFGAVSFLFMGDLESDGEEALVASGQELGATVLKIGHHGSRYSTGEAFLQAVQPKMAVISVGATNGYGHPHGDTLARLEAVGAEVWRTDLCGAMVFRSDGKTVAVVDTVAVDGIGEAA